MFELNNRELALVIWLAIVLTTLVMLSTTDSDIRGSLKQVVRATFVGPIMMSVGAMVSWMIICILLLQAVGLWDRPYLKTTLVWFATFGIVTMFDIRRISEHDIFFKKTVRDSIGGTAVVAFISELQSFHLIIELILVPLLTFVTMMRIMADYQPESETVKGFLDALLSMAGIIIFAWSAYHLIAAWQQLATMKTAMDFMVPVTLTLVYLPFIYVFSVYIAYSELNTRISFFLEDDRLRQYAIWLAFFSFRGNLDALNRWSRKIRSEKITDKPHCQRTIGEILKIIQHEKNPPAVDPAEGWSPYEAMRFLDAADFRMEDYHETYDEEWTSASSPVEIRNGSFSDTIFYRVGGDNLVARELKLDLKVELFEHEAYAESELFYLCVEMLLLTATELELNEDLMCKLTSNQNSSLVFGHTKLESSYKNSVHGTLKIHRKSFRLSKVSKDDA